VLASGGRPGVIEPPAGYVAPAWPSLRAAIRTALTMGFVVPDFALRLLWANRHAQPGSTNTAEGLAGMRRFSVRALRSFGVPLEIIGTERVPSEGGLLFMWNQTTHLDHLILAAAMPRPFLSLYNNEVAAKPIYGEHLRRAGHFHVDRTNEVQWRESIARAAAALNAGACILLSPEGTRSWDARLLPMKRGAFELAREAGRPIVCVTVIGGSARLGRGCMVVRPGPIRVVFSAPLTGEPLEEQVVATFEATLREWALESSAP
jgi:1-acyl-sn-glycerol-3-phosphate acyltransferase